MTSQTDLWILEARRLRAFLDTIEHPEPEPEEQDADTPDQA